ncbi:thiamine pyrophosphate-binding protein [Amorphus orientalis]|uniref:Acetolactate synthase-1/2/3 large subunit n=1 Tax=Amorphus orientalis TaxID=649198 RepID=A0AAE3VLL6_9HYPH|nr:thiamine pyrophosphate-binding protein [Amorphus orientalis]MDQ0314769.1 acetolactate synthase-1/2/3 large subunit [Amorphus orientalis]
MSSSDAQTSHLRSGGALLVDCLKANGVDRAFCIPGESYLAVLDAFVDADIPLTVGRQEGGVSMMAEAWGKMTGRPGICLVTRGPGATNAAAGVHIAQQDSTPMILLVGQVARDMRGRDAFQEVDFVRMFGGMAKWVAEIDAAERIPEMIARAFATAMSGRPGPVVLALPEDMLTERVDARPVAATAPAEPAPSTVELARLEMLLQEAERPIAIVGGSRWSAAAAKRLDEVSRAWALPVATAFRRQDLVDNLHPNFAGDVGIGINPALKARIEAADLILLVGDRLSEMASQSYSLIDIPTPRQTLVHVHPGSEELGRVYQPTLGINATPRAFLDAWASLPVPNDPAWAGAADQAHADYLAWSEPTVSPGAVDMGAVMAAIRDRLPEDAIVTNGAGNFAGWVHRFHRYRTYGSELAPTSGTMGYGLPAAIAAKLRHPERTVLCVAGDGDLQMTIQELGTVLQEQLAIILIVVDNGAYGTIRMHQEREYPGRISATSLINPDFATLGEAYGAFVARVDRTEDFAPAFEDALGQTRLSLLHVKTDPEAITPATTLSAIRAAALSRLDT